MGSGLAIDACADSARGYHGGMTIIAPLARLAGLTAALVASTSAPASIPPPPSAVELAQQGEDIAWSITEDLTTEIYTV